jgi:O-methyltransferase
MPNPIAFAFLDGDFYDSILESLKLIWPRMNPRGIILIDDYQRPELPGVERAVYDFFQGKAMPTIQVEHNIALIKIYDTRSH